MIRRPQSDDEGEYLAEQRAEAWRYTTERELDYAADRYGRRHYG